MVGSGMGTGSLDVVVYCASYKDIAARDKYSVGKMRAVGGERSVMEKRIPLLHARRQSECRLLMSQRQ